jgi:hypothetical protein
MYHIHGIIKKEIDQRLWGLSHNFIWRMFFNKPELGDFFDFSADTRKISQCHGTSGKSKSCAVHALRSCNPRGDSNFRNQNFKNSFYFRLQYPFTKFETPNLGLNPVAVYIHRCYNSFFHFLLRQSAVHFFQRQGEQWKNHRV